MLLGYGDDHRLSYYAVLAYKHTCEKRPDCLSPTRIAPLSLAAFLSLASSES